MKQYEINGVLDLLSQPCPPDMDETIEILYGSPLKVISETIRGYIVAPPGKVLRVGDFSSIEARGIAWLAGAEHILDVFRTGADIYCKAAEDIYSKPINKKDHPYERGVGKVVVLACGYQGSVGAFQKMARGYDVVVTDETALSVVKAWRSKNPEIVGYWKNVESAAVAAVVDRAKGTVHKVGPPGREVRFGVRGAFLRCRLPSGRFLSYPYPRLVDYVWIRKGAVGMVEANGDEPAILEVGAQSRKVPVAELSRWIARGWTQNGNPSPAIHYKYYEKQKWVEGSTYGGSIVENITQGLCRDILCEAMLRLDLECYDLTMHFHDEPVAETLEDFGSTEELVRIMEIPPYWAGGFPIEVGKDAYASRRYRK